MRALALAVILLATPATAQDLIAGRAMAIDGDTLLLRKENGAEVRVRLWGIDAPEMAVWPWGPQARRQLDDILATNDARVTCQPNGRSHNRVVATCILTGKAEDIGAALIASGLAVEHRVYTRGQYGFAEYEARSRKLGVWRD